MVEAIIFFYFDDGSSKIKRIVDDMSNKYKLITVMPVNNSEVRDWLKFNSKGVHIKSVPVFVILEKNTNVNVLDYEHKQLVYDLCDNINK